MSEERFAQVALPLPVARPYTYRIPESLGDRVGPGSRVVVPVRRQEMIGIVTALGGDAPAEPRDILASPDEEAAIPGPLLELAAKAAVHWGSPPGLMLRAMLPAALWGKTNVRLELLRGAPRQAGGVAGELLHWLDGRGGSANAGTAARALKRDIWPAAERLRRVGALAMEVIPADVAAGVQRRRVAVLPNETLSLLEREQRFERAPARAALYQQLESAGGRLHVPALLEASGVSRGALDAMVKQGLVSIELEESRRDPFSDIRGTAPPAELTAAQHGALAELAALQPGQTALLFGVTGSGKTAVYLERVRQMIAAGRGSILLVPEIALTPQTVARVRGAFGDQVAVLHSGLSDGERADAWRSLRRGERLVAVGARSAVFAPVRNLGLVVLDEEHEASYKNGETPRHHARDIARMRARIEGATLVLGTATPSLETWHAASATGRIIHLPERIASRPMPPVELVDLRIEPQVNGAGLPWSEKLDQALATTLARGEQALLLLNRRGWAAFLQCAECGEAVECPDCSIALTVHSHPDLLRCHYCDYQAPIPLACPICAGTTVRNRGAGTQQLERLVAERFPEARVARMDLDTTAAKWSHHRILERVGKGEVDILLGTQMIAKGIDFPNVTLVGVVDADVALHLPDFRSAERTFQLVAQVAGRAGRGPRGCGWGSTCAPPCWCRPVSCSPARRAPCCRARCPTRTPRSPPDAPRCWCWPWPPAATCCCPPPRNASTNASAPS